MAGGRRGEEVRRRSLAEQVEDDLYGFDGRSLDGTERFVDSLDAHPVMEDLAPAHQIVEPVEHLVVVVDRGRRAVQLHQVERLDLEVHQAPVDEAFDGLGRVGVGNVRIESTTRLGGHHHLSGRPLAAEPGDQPLRTAVAVHIGGVDEA